MLRVLYPAALAWDFTLGGIHGDTLCSGCSVPDGGSVLRQGGIWTGNKRTRKEPPPRTGETMKNNNSEMNAVWRSFGGFRNSLPSLMLCMLFGTVSCLASHAQSPLRDPTPAEKKVLDQYTGVIHPFLDTFDSDDWDTRVDYDVDDNVLVSQGNEYPLDVDELIQRSYTVKKDSPLYQREIAPFLAKMEQMSPTELAQAGQKLKLLRLEVQVHFNRAGADTDAKTKAQLQIPGAAYSYMTEESQDKRSQSIVLLFGDWKSATVATQGLMFHFKHPPHTPVVENVVIQLQGSPDRIRELLRSADWRKVNDALVGARS